MAAKRGFGTATNNKPNTCNELAAGPLLLMLNCLGGTARQGGAAKNNLDVSQVWIRRRASARRAFPTKLNQDDPCQPFLRNRRL